MVWLYPLSQRFSLHAQPVCHIFNLSAIRSLIKLASFVIPSCNLIAGKLQPSQNSPANPQGPVCCSPLLIALRRQTADWLAGVACQSCREVKRTTFSAAAGSGVSWEMWISFPYTFKPGLGVWLLCLSGQTRKTGECQGYMAHAQLADGIITRKIAMQYYQLHIQLFIYPYNSK